MPTLSELNPLAKVNINIGTFGNVLMVLVITVLILVLLGVAVWLFVRRKQYKYIIPVYSLIGNRPTRVGVYRAKNVPISKAGDNLWFVNKIKKYIPPATIQSAPNEFWHWVRDDGEWINFAMQDLDVIQKKAGAFYIHQDMRSQRIATAQLLEQRLLQKSFWEKYGLIIGYVIFFLVITVAMIIIFYQYSQIVQQTSDLLSVANSLLERAIKLERGDSGSLVPAMILPFLIKRKWLSG